MKKIYQYTIAFSLLIMLSLSVFGILKPTKIEVVRADIPYDENGEIGLDELIKYIDENNKLIDVQVCVDYKCKFGKLGKGAVFTAFASSTSHVS